MFARDAAHSATRWPFSLVALGRRSWTKGTAIRQGERAFFFASALVRGFAPLETIGSSSLMRARSIVQAEKRALSRREHAIMRGIWLTP